MFQPIDTLLVAATMVLAADGVPTFNVESHCHKVAHLAKPVGDVDACLRLEQEARDQLVKQWTQFLPAERAHCLRLTTLGGDPNLHRASHLLGNATSRTKYKKTANVIVFLVSTAPALRQPLRMV